MKPFVIGMIIIVFCLCLSPFGGGASAWSYCTDHKCKCCLPTDNSLVAKYVGDVTVTRCWKWSELNCVYCGGDKQPEKNCNKTYPKCNNACIARDCTFK